MKRVEFFMGIVMVMGLLPVWSVAFAEKEGTMSDALSVIHNRKSVRSFTGQSVGKDAQYKFHIMLTGRNRLVVQARPG